MIELRHWVKLGGLFAATLVAYIVFFQGCMHLRVYQGPWEVMFEREADGTPLIRINQAHLEIHDVRLRFPGAQLKEGFEASTVQFDEHTRMVPFGEFIYHDLMHLPGVVVLELYNHKVELLPRVLKVGKEEIPWKSASLLELEPLESPMVDESSL